MDVNLKAAVTTGGDSAILAECEHGEDEAIAEYCHALEHHDLPISVRSVLQQQAMGVKAAHDHVHDLRTSGQLTSARISPTSVLNRASMAP